MTRTQGLSIGKWSVALDAAFCLSLGVLVAVKSADVATHVTLSEPFVFVVGAIVIVWSAAIVGALAGLQLRNALMLVLSVNLGAVVLLAIALQAVSTPFMATGVLAILLSVVFFAGSQCGALYMLSATNRSASKRHDGDS
jgi:hypothetical protein